MPSAFPKASICSTRSGGNLVVTKVPRVAMFCVRGLFHKGTPLPLTAAMEGKERGDYGRWCPATGGVRVNLRRRHRRRPGLSAGAFLCTNVAGCAGAGETVRLGVNGGVLNPTFSRSRQSRPLAFRHVLAWLAPPMPASTRSTMARVGRARSLKQHAGLMAGSICQMLRAVFLGNVICTPRHKCC